MTPEGLSMSVYDLDDMEISRIWRPIFVTLSMACTENYWPEMGLNVKPNDTLAEISRFFVKNYYDELKPLNVLWGETFGRVQSELGPSVAASLYCWGMTTEPRYSHEMRYLHDWDFVLRRLLAGEIPNAPLVPLKIPKHKQDSLKELVAESIETWKKTRNDLEGLLTNTSSEWEIYLCTVFRTLYGPEINPIDWLIVCLEVRGSIALWEKIRSLLSQDEFELLGHWAKEQMSAMGWPADYQIEPIHFSFPTC